MQRCIVAKSAPTVLLLQQLGLQNGASLADCGAAACMENSSAALSARP